MLDSSWAGSADGEQAGMALLSWGCRAVAPPLQPWPEPCSLSLPPSVMDLALALIHTPPRPPYPLTQPPKLAERHP